MSNVLVFWTSPTPQRQMASYIGSEELEEKFSTNSERKEHHGQDVKRRKPRMEKTKIEGPEGRKKYERYRTKSHVCDVCEVRRFQCFLMTLGLGFVVIDILIRCLRYWAFCRWRAGILLFVCMSPSSVKGNSRRTVSMKLILVFVHDAPKRDVPLDEVSSKRRWHFAQHAIS